MSYRSQLELQNQIEAGETEEIYGNDLPDPSDPQDNFSTRYLMFLLELSGGPYRLTKYELKVDDKLIESNPEYN